MDGRVLKNEAILEKIHHQTEAKKLPAQAGKDCWILKILAFMLPVKFIVVM